MCIIMCFKYKRFKLPKSKNDGGKKVYLYSFMLLFSQTVDISMFVWPLAQSAWMFRVFRLSPALISVTDLNTHTQEDILH